jgi:hypothetical protein
VNNNLPNKCYLCGVPVREYKLKAGKKHPSDELVPDHVPPKGLFLKPRLDLIEVPCCFSCNNKHSGFDERLRILASMPFDRNKVGQIIMEKEVVGGTMAKGRQMRFVEKLLASMETVSGRPELVRTRIDAREFNEGMIQITKGLLFTLHPNIDYHRSVFKVDNIRQQSSDKQLRRMARLKRGKYFERGGNVFQCWRNVDELRGVGEWMLIFYGGFGYFVLHTNGRKARWLSILTFLKEFWFKINHCQPSETD